MLFSCYWNPTVLTVGGCQSRYKQTLFNAGFNHRVNIVTIDPKNTSKIGKQKYCGSRKLNVHQAASYVIARRGQGYLDRLVV